MSKYKMSIFLVIIFVFIFIVIYNIYDNNRFILVSEEVNIDSLPDDFEGFTILQISDLHEKRFGDNQEKLTEAINNLDYDIIALTGDMQSINSKDDKPLLELIDGIKNKEYMFYVSGNHGPAYSDKLKSRGVIALDKPYEIIRGKSSMIFYDFYDGVDFSDSIKDYDSNINIGITHYPWDKGFYLNAQDKIGEYDLVLSGHYHGGQVRIPFYGALYIPNLNEGIYFPNQYDVSGLQEYGNYKQYISRGLGASSGSILSRYRIFNSPEINLIKLVKS